LATFNLTRDVTASAAGSQPHRALWDTVGTALLLEALVSHGWTAESTLEELLAAASVPLDGTSSSTTCSPTAANPASYKT